MRVYVLALLLGVVMFSTEAARAVMLRKLAAPSADNNSPEPNENTVIGVLTQPLVMPGDTSWNESYFPASYPNYISMSGARAAPVVCDIPLKDLKNLYDSINGLLVPGGGQDLRAGNCYYDAMAHIVRWAMADFDATGEVFPIHFTCLGWEAAAVFVTDNPYILSNFTGALGVADVLHWTDDAASAWPLRLVPGSVFAAARTENLAFEAHHYGVWLPDFWGTELAEFWTLLSTTADAAGKEYVSSVVATRYPFIALQWHPEKNSFEWGSENIPHSVQALQLAQAVGLAFVQEARKSTHRFASDEDRDAALIYNFTPDPGHGYFMQVYTFPRRDAAP